MRKAPDSMPIVRTPNLSGISHYKAMLPIIINIIESGVSNLHKVADELNRQGFRTFRNHLWRWESVYRCLKYKNGAHIEKPKRSVPEWLRKEAGSD